MARSTETLIENLSEDESWRLLAGENVGRLAVRDGDGIDIFPINFLVKERTVYFRSAPGSKLMELTRHPLVAFEADGAAASAPWSVVVKGEAVRLGSDEEILSSGVKELHSASPTDKWNYVRITPNSITGRRFSTPPTR
jgi:nitroimidazol reductase NimA-like FMN-containing flavoprotein (pyridoxamine 5'-phosphate oxidase superfamily)